MHFIPPDVDYPSHLYTVGHAATLFQPTASDRALREAVDLTLSMSSMDEQSQQTQSSADLDDCTHSASQQTHAQVVDLVNSSHNKRDLKQNGVKLKDKNILQSACELRKQGRWTETLAKMDDDISWKSCLVGLSETTYSFAIRSLVDSLPTNANLALWKKILSDHCGSCRLQKQTLLHVLSNCSVKLACYSWRHNNILLRLKNFVCEHLSELEIHCDLVVENNLFKSINVNTVPIDICITNLRPDLVIIDRVEKVVTIVELTVPFEENILSAQERKSVKYRGLVSAIEEKGFICNFHTVEVGARGIVGQGTNKLLRQICRSKRQETRALVKSLSQTAMKCSYLIFREKDNVSAIFHTVL